MAQKSSDGRIAAVRRNSWRLVLQAKSECLVPSCCINCSRQLIIWNGKEEHAAPPPFCILSLAAPLLPIEAEFHSMQSSSGQPVSEHSFCFCSRRYSGLSLVSLGLCAAVSFGRQAKITKEAEPKIREHLWAQRRSVKQLRAVAAHRKTVDSKGNFGDGVPPVHMGRDYSTREQS